MRISIINSDGLTKRGPGARNIGGHFLVFQSKVTPKKGHCFKGGNFLVFRYKVVSKKKFIILRVPPSRCYCK